MSPSSVTDVGTSLIDCVTTKSGIEYVKLLSAPSVKTTRPANVRSVPAAELTVS